MSSGETSSAGRIGALGNIVCVLTCSVAMSSCQPPSQRDLMAPFATADGRPVITCDLEVITATPRRLQVRLTVTNLSQTVVHVFDDGDLHRMPYGWLDDLSHLTIAWRDHLDTPRFLHARSSHNSYRDIGCATKLGQGGCYVTQQN